MLEATQPQNLPAPRPPMPIGRVDLSKWPPDDNDLPAGPPPGGGLPAGGGGYDLGGGDFKKGRFNPVVILVAIVAVVGLAVMLLIGFKTDAQRVEVQDAEKIKQQIYVMAKADQLPQWRKWAVSDQSDYLKQEALKQLAWAEDPGGVDLAIKALSSQSEAIQGMAATVLAEYGSPAADKAKEPLLAAFKTAGPGAKPQIAWALVALGDNRNFDKILDLYRVGHLSTVQRLGGGLAFDADKIVKLVSLDKLASYASDSSPAVRQLVATVLSQNADAKYTEVLIKLLQDTDGEISRQAAPGLGKIGDERAREPLIKALRGTDKESRRKYLEALRDGTGAQGLVVALDTVAEDNEKSRWYQTNQIYEMLEKLADPRVGDSLMPVLEKNPHIHWQITAAIIMASVGDLRAVPTLAKTLRMDPQKIYSDDNDWEQLLKRDSNERVVAARMIADLAVMHPEKVEDIRNQAEDAVIFWIHELPSPHANGLRALAAMGSTKDIEALRDWANPDAPLPKEGQQPPMPEEWVVAQSALRYVGWLKDEPSWKVLDKALTRRPKEIDVTMDGLMQGGLAILGMTLRALGVGASEGFSQWGDPRAVKPLMKYIEEVRENEQSRMAACAALAWVGEEKDMLEVAKKIQDYNGEAKSDQFRRACLLETLIQRPVPGTADALLQLMTPMSAMETRHQVAHAIGKAGLTEETQAKLFEMMNDEQMMNDAALALILGGKPDVAARAVAMYAGKPKEALDELQSLYYYTFGYWSTDDLDKGRIFNWVDNAEAISHITIKETPQEWARTLLMRQFNNLMFDNGPHSFTRVVLRCRLMQMAKGDDAEKRAGAIRALKFMKEQGVLLALRGESGPTGELAASAYHELMNPVVEKGGVIKTEDKNAEDKDPLENMR
jgi:HEAT repeat protein